MKFRSFFPQPLPASMCIGAVTQYIIVIYISIFLLRDEPRWQTVLFVLGVTGPHFVAIYLIRRPSSWRIRTREQRIVFITGYIALPTCCLTLLVGLGVEDAVVSVIGRALNDWAIGIAGLSLFMSLGTLLIAGTLLSNRRLFYQSHCRSCLYDLTSGESDTCPECNTPITRSAEAAS